MEKILRTKIYNTLYWKEHCFALTAESLVDKAVELHFVGGTFGGQVCLDLACRRQTSMYAATQACLQDQPSNTMSPTEISLMLIAESSNRVYVPPAEAAAAAA